MIPAGAEAELWPQGSRVYLGLGVLLGQAAEALLQMPVHPVGQLPPLRYLLAEGVVVLDEAQDVPPVLIGPQAVARDQSRGRRGGAVRRAPAALGQAVHIPARLPLHLCTTQGVLFL